MEDSDVIAEYAIGLGDEVGHGVPKRFRRRHVLFVEWFDGWTGFVSACVLVEPRGRRRYTFNRTSKPGTIKHRQHVAFEDRGPDTAVFDSESDAAQPNLSLSGQRMSKAMRRLAWRVDYWASVRTVAQGRHPQGVNVLD